MKRREMLLATAAIAATVALPNKLALSATTLPSKPYGLPISSDFPYKKKQVNVLDSNMAYIQ